MIALGMERRPSVAVPESTTTSGTSDRPLEAPRTELCRMRDWSIFYLLVAHRALSPARQRIGRESLGRAIISTHRITTPALPVLLVTTRDFQFPSPIKYGTSTNQTFLASSLLRSSTTTTRAPI